MKIKTSDLIGPALDWAVAKIDQQQWSDYDCLLWVQDDEYQYSPSTAWSQAGPILDREEIGFAKYGPNGSWKAVIGATPRGTPHYGPTPLIAAMRCLVASKLGVEVDVPDELANQHED